MEIKNGHGKTPLDPQSLLLKTVRAIKVILKTSPTGILIFLGLFLFYNPVFSAIPFEDDFNAYIPNDSLAGQGDWTGGEEKSISDDDCFEGFCVLGSPSVDVVKRIGVPITAAGSFFTYWQWKTYGVTSAGTLRIYNINDVQKFKLALVMGANGVWAEHGLNDIAFSTTPLENGVWNKVECQWAEGFLKMRCKLNDEDFGDWVDVSGAEPHHFLTIGLENIGSNWQFDYISQTEYGLFPGFSVLIEPTYPPDCQNTTTTSPLNFNATGKITIPTENFHTYNKFYFWAENLDTGNFQYASTTFSPPLKAGDNKTYSIPVSLPDGVYKISYVLWGYFPVDIPAFSVAYEHYCEITRIGTKEFIPSLIVPEFPEYEPEECSEYALLERLVCEIKNFIKSLVYPTTSKISELYNNLSIFKTKIPLNYLSATKDFVLDVKNSIATTTSFEISLLYATTTIDISNLEFLEVEGNVGGNNFSLKDIIKIFGYSILIGSFTFWAIDFKNRIFK